MGGARGFTLIEVVATVTILALAAGVVLASGSTRAELRETTGKLCGTIRATYDRAVLTGQTQRLVFAFDKPIIKVEGTEQAVALNAEGNALVLGAQAAKAAGGAESLLSGLPALLGDAKGSAEQADERDDEDAPTSPLEALLGLNEVKLAGDSTAFKSAGHDLKLPDSVHLLDVWIEGMSLPASEGQVYLYFFPHGYTQDALVHLQDAENHVFTVKVAALTGKTSIVDEYVEAPK